MGTVYVDVKPYYKVEYNIKELDSAVKDGTFKFDADKKANAKLIFSAYKNTLRLICKKLDVDDVDRASCNDSYVRITYVTKEARETNPPKDCGVVYAPFLDHIITR